MKALSLPIFPRASGGKNDREDGEGRRSGSHVVAVPTAKNEATPLGRRMRWDEGTAVWLTFARGFEYCYPPFQRCWSVVRVPAQNSKFSLD